MRVLPGNPHLLDIGEFKAQILHLPYKEDNTCEMLVPVPAGQYQVPGETSAVIMQDRVGNDNTKTWIPSFQNGWPGHKAMSI